MKTVTLTFKITIDATQQIIFNYVSEWDKQSDWILFTTVKELPNVDHRPGPMLLATTKFGPLKFVDTMVVTDLRPFERIVVEHTGRIILGKGIFTIRKIAGSSSEFVWQEITPVPFGFIGQVGLILVKPFMNIMFGMSLKKLKTNIELLD